MYHQNRFPHILETTNSYLEVKSDKAATLISDNKYKEAAETYATCVKYGINIVNNTGYINALSKYADSELVKKANLNEEDITNYYSVGDIDNDGTLEVAVFERNYSSEEYIPSNIQLFKYTDGDGLTIFYCDYDLLNYDLNIE
ncbi:hypothetical protein [Clostridium estertheticum]|uniref:hypothetical protein n=1 Tax=Clostridium estertheticum TaxID=238834 RepID=UPI001C7CDE16|nr:hypothetical protein [Clostridium estertheticum]MBX4265138.1 hypothetical protein [Clostridium estertheticum]WLC88598.1 hypothetical protein KTC95_21830 [Clostridium estertheticum]